ncbi:UNVERIFIED_CONTAM: Cytochrome c oxidase subunitC [Sesamum calycinum]|uniref:Cytochrome c oxidase subunitC n=1 Tax=Sesamum calycinum TaxID=2727403 RepID=A0AAW2MMQ5_9LAMI
MKRDDLFPSNVRMILLLQFSAPHRWSTFELYACPHRILSCLASRLFAKVFGCLELRNLLSSNFCNREERMAAAHVVYKGPSILKEILIGIGLGLVAGGFWKMHHWNNQKRTKEFYDLLDKGEISVVREDE